MSVLCQRPIDNFIVDFYVPKCKLVIEVDGDSDFTVEGQARDSERTAILESYGLTILRFSNVEVQNTFESVCLKLNAIIIEKTTVN